METVYMIKNTNKNKNTGLKKKPKKRAKINNY